jgi:uncharacterized protein (TIGR02646 family)
MIPVTLQPEPPDFKDNVRKKGHDWLRSKGIALNAAPPKASDLPNYWTHSNKQLWQAYSGVCAYLAIYFDWGMGAASTDHFVAKSKHAGDAYEWNNYRLSCLGANRNKNKFDDVMDPIGLKPDTFILNLLSGKISPNPDLSPEDSDAARKTITRLDLDSPENNAMRAKHFSRYLRGMHEQDLKELSPFVWLEAQRQGLL